MYFITPYLTPITHFDANHTIINCTFHGSRHTHTHTKQSLSRKCYQATYLRLKPATALVSRINASTLLCHRRPCAKKTASPASPSHSTDLILDDNETPYIDGTKLLLRDSAPRHRWNKPEAHPYPHAYIQSDNRLAVQINGYRKGGGAKSCHHHRRIHPRSIR